MNGETCNPTISLGVYSGQTTNTTRSTLIWYTNGIGLRTYDEWPGWPMGVIGCLASQGKARGTSCGRAGEVFHPIISEDPMFP